MGLLDWNDKQQMGLLGMSVLANSGKGNLRSLGSGLQQGLALDNQMKTQALERQQLERKNRMEDEALMSARESERAKQLRLQALRESLKQAHPNYTQLLDSLSDEKLEQLGGVQAESGMFPKPEEWKSEGGKIYKKHLGSDGNLVGVGDVTPAIPFGYNPDGSMLPGFEGSKTRVAAAGAPRTSIQNINAQEAEQSKVYGKTLGDIRGSLAQSSMEGPAKLARLNRMDQLLGDFEGGKLAAAGVTLASALNSIGLKIDPKLGDKEAAISLARDIAASFRKSGTGPMTDKDFENFLLQVPDLAKSAAGRKQIIQTMSAAVRRDMEAHKLASAYAQQNGGVIDDRFLVELTEFYANNPVVAVTQSDTSGMESLRARASEILKRRSSQGVR